MCTRGWTNRRPRGLDRQYSARGRKGKSMTGCKQYIGGDPSGHFRKGFLGIEPQALLNHVDEEHRKQNHRYTIYGHNGMADISKLESLQSNPSNI